LPRPARAFLSYPTRLKEGDEFVPLDQHRTFIIDGWKSSLDPFAHGIFMFIEQIGDFFYRVAAVAFYMAVIGVTFSHNGYPPPLALRFRLIAHLTRGCLALAKQCLFRHLCLLAASCV
jgi:hypothetical protein